MQALLETLASLKPQDPTILVLAMLAAGAGMLVWSLLANRAERGGVRRRLRLETEAEPAQTKPDAKRRADAIVSESTVAKAKEFYVKNDPESVARLRMKLIQAGFMEPSAVGHFFVARFALLIVGALVALASMRFSGTDSGWVSQAGYVIFSAAFGYFLPAFWLSRQMAAKLTEYRHGFPDFMDLMIVCADAGMSLEAAVDRVSREITKTYPSLSQNLMLVTIELRAGRQMQDALKGLAERIGLDEVRSFATLLQQSKELGTSLSTALRVFSDEMRHKRMSLAEEKAHSLPAKMSVPVTMCILPVVMLIAVIPVIVQVAGAK